MAPQTGSRVPPGDDRASGRVSGDHAARRRFDNRPRNGATGVGAMLRLPCTGSATTSSLPRASADRNGLPTRLLSCLR